MADHTAPARRAQATRDKALHSDSKHGRAALIREQRHRLEESGRDPDVKTSNLNDPDSRGLVS